MSEYGNERWKQVEGFKYYEVSDHGRVRSHPRPEAPNHQRGVVILRPNSNTYLQVTLCESGVLYYRSIHGLVARHFLGAPSKDKPHINHLDGDKRNNHYTNLRWVDRSENMQHAVQLGLHSVVGEANNKAKLTASQVVDIRRRLLEKGHTRKLMAEIYCVSKSTIDYIVTRRTWKHLN